MNTNLSVTGKLSIQLFDKDMKLVEERNVNNLVVTAGKNWIISRMISDVSGGSALMSYMAIGSSSTSPVVGDTTLTTETSRKPPLVI